jgi:hypothetical protein
MNGRVFVLASEREKARTGPFPRTRQRRGPRLVGRARARDGEFVSAVREVAFDRVLRALSRGKAAAGVPGSTSRRARNPHDVGSVTWGGGS